MSGLLDVIGYQSAGDRAPWCHAYALSTDGRWRTPFASGQAGPSGHGAELIGTAARNAARDRRVRALQAEAAELRDQAAALRRTVADLRDLG